MTATLSHEILHPATLSSVRREEVFGLFASCYDCVEESAFEKDLAQKTSIILLTEENDRVVGFSTQQVHEWSFAGEPIRVLYSGDTIINPAYWGNQGLARAWCTVAAQAMLGPPATRTFWFLISKGCRTYLYLPLFFRNFIPGVSAGAPSEWMALLDELARAKFGVCYNAQSGLIRFPASRGQLTPELATIPPGRQNDPHVNYFLEQNPDFATGVELACLAEISLENTRGIGRRWLSQALSQQNAGKL